MKALESGEQLSTAVRELHGLPLEPDRTAVAAQLVGGDIELEAAERGYLQFFRFHSFDSVGRLVNITEVTSRTRLIHGDNPETPDVVEPYYLKGSGTNRVTNLNPVDGSVINVTEGCNQSTSAPLLFQN